MNCDKTFKRNIITTLRWTDISKTEKGRNDDDDDDNDTNILDGALKPQMTVTTLSFDPNIQILPLIIFLSHKSQRFHDHRHLAFCNSYT